MTTVELLQRELHRLPDEVASSPWLTRLDRLGFLGLLDRRPDGRPSVSRLEHSLAVATAAQEVGSALGLPDADLRLLVTAATVHDIGHLPLSHSLEAQWRDVAGVDHHAAGEWLIVGCGPIPRAETLAPVLESVGLRPEAVWDIVAPTRAPNGSLGGLLTGRMNLDTFHGMAVASRALALEPVLPPDQPFSMSNGRIVVDPEAVPACDAFWLDKARVYRDGINAPWAAAAELEAARLSADAMRGFTVGDIVRMSDDDFLSRLSWTPAHLFAEVRTREYRYEADGRVVGHRLLRSHRVDPTVETGSSGLSMADAARRYVVDRHARPLHEMPRDQA